MQTNELWCRQTNCGADKRTVVQTNELWCRQTTWCRQTLWCRQTNCGAAKRTVVQQTNCSADKRIVVQTCYNGRLCPKNGLNGWRSLRRRRRRVWQRQRRRSPCWANAAPSAAGSTRRRRSSCFRCGYRYNVDHGMAERINQIGRHPAAARDRRPAEAWKPSSAFTGAHACRNRWTMFQLRQRGLALQLAAGLRQTALPRRDRRRTLSAPDRGRAACAAPDARARPAGRRSGAGQDHRGRHRHERADPARPRAHGAGADARLADGTVARGAAEQVPRGVHGHGDAAAVAGRARSRRRPLDRQPRSRQAGCTTARLCSAASTTC